MYSVFLSSYTNTRESLGGLEKAVETLACIIYNGNSIASFLRIQTDISTEHDLMTRRGRYVIVSNYK